MTTSFCLFAEDETFAVHEAGHAVAAIRAGWPFSHIEVTEDGGALVITEDLRLSRRWYRAQISRIRYGDEKFRHEGITFYLAGAAAERLFYPVRNYTSYPSPEDVIPLVQAGYYPSDTLSLLDFTWIPSVDKAREEIKSNPHRSRRNWKRKARRIERKIKEQEAELDAIFAPDWPLVEAFVKDNQRTIEDVAVELLHADNLTLGYDDICAVVEAA